MYYSSAFTSLSYKWIEKLQIAILSWAILPINVFRVKLLYLFDTNIALNTIFNIILSLSHIFFKKRTYISKKVKKRESSLNKK